MVRKAVFLCVGAMNHLPQPHDNVSCSTNRRNFVPQTGNTEESPEFGVGNRNVEGAFCVCGCVIVVRSRPCAVNIAIMMAIP